MGQGDFDSGLTKSWKPRNKIKISKYLIEACFQKKVKQYIRGMSLFGTNKFWPEIELGKKVNSINF